MIKRVNRIYQQIGYDLVPGARASHGRPGSISIKRPFITLYVDGPRHPIKYGMRKNDGRKNG